MSAHCSGASGAPNSAVQKAPASRCVQRLMSMSGTSAIPAPMRSWWSSRRSGVLGRLAAATVRLGPARHALGKSRRSTASQAAAAVGSGA